MVVSCGVGDGVLGVAGAACGGERGGAVADAVEVQCAGGDRGVVAVGGESYRGGVGGDYAVSGDSEGGGREEGEGGEGGVNEWRRIAELGVCGI